VAPHRLGDAGMVTAEAAVVLPVLVLVLAAALAAVSVVTAQMRCTDAAREGARAAARGESDAAVRQIAASSAPDGSAVSVTRDGATATVQVSASVALFPGLGPSMRVTDSATAVLEPGLDAGVSAFGGGGNNRGRDSRGPP
jgi:Flp pilus assembly protein TadG